MFRCPPKNYTMEQYFSQPFPKPGRNVFTILCSITALLSLYILCCMPSLSRALCISPSSPTFTTSIHKYRVPQKACLFLKFGGIVWPTVLVLRMAHRKWKNWKQQPSMLPGLAVSVWLLLSFFPFPAGHPEHEHCIANNNPRQSYLPAGSVPCTKEDVNLQSRTPLWAVKRAFQFEIQ